MNHYRKHVMNTCKTNILESARALKQASPVITQPKTIGSFLALLLSLVLLPTLLKADQSRPFRGSLEGFETHEFLPTTLLVEGSGGGKATHLGQFKIAWHVVVDLASLQGIGSAELTASNGDVLTADVLGQGTPTDIPGGFSVQEIYTITGGTGRFAGATGTLAVHRLVDPDGTTRGIILGTVRLDRDE